MARGSKAKGVYARGRFWLDHDRRADGTLRSPFYAIFWYDDGRGRIRSASTRTGDLPTARTALDRHYLEHTEGEAICPTCGQRRQLRNELLLLQAITDYLAANEGKESIGAIRPRLAHVIAYIATLPSPDVRCDQVDEDWISRLRTWLAKQPMVSSAGKTLERERTASTIENSVIQLAAAVNAAHRRGDTARPARFKPIQTKELNRTPQHRLSVEDLGAAFRYATDPRFPAKRRGLHRFLMLSVGTAARPDATHDFSTTPARRQWNEERRVIALNPAGRRQTRKRRATVIAPARLAERVAEVQGHFVPVTSVRSAWDTMVAELGWPQHGEGGMKLIRRSVAQLLRDAGTPRAWSEDWRDPTRKVPQEQIELQLGHRAQDSVTDLYAAFDPHYLSAATLALDGIIAAIEEFCPAAFGRARSTA